MKWYVFLMSATLLITTSCSEQKECVEDPIDYSDVSTGNENEVQSVNFPSEDGLEITANLYEVGKDAPTIVLCHQARFNKFEYEGIAQRLNDLGFNCLAIDQRSGGPIANEVNETHLLAEAQGKPTDYLDAKQDINAAVNYAAENFNGKLILWGSSYSSTLVLYVGNENEHVDAIVSYSPGNYFKDDLGDLVTILASCEKPFYLTSSKAEAPEVKQLVGETLQDNQIVFEPEGPGHHGSRALWEHQSGGGEYWESIESFLAVIQE